MTSWRGVDLSLVVTLYDVYVYGFWFSFFHFFIFLVFFTEAYVCRDEERELCGNTLVLMCFEGEYLSA